MRAKAIARGFTVLPQTFWNYIDRYRGRQYEWSGYTRNHAHDLGQTLTNLLRMMTIHNVQVNCGMALAAQSLLAEDILIPLASSYDKMPEVTKMRAQANQETGLML